MADKIFASWLLYSPPYNHFITSRRLSDGSMVAGWGASPGGRAVVGSIASVTGGIRAPILTFNDGSCIVLCVASLSAGDFNLYAQKYAADGTALWGSWVLVWADAPAAYNPKSLNLCSDGSGGCFVAWTVMSSGGQNSGAKAYIQKISASGVTLESPVEITYESDGYYPSIYTCDIISDGVGGCIYGYVRSHRISAGSADLYHAIVTRYTAALSPTWSVGSDHSLARITSSYSGYGDEMSLQLVGDKLGGAFLAVGASNASIQIAHLLAASGALDWITGNLVAGDTGRIGVPWLCPDGAGGLVAGLPCYTGYSGTWACRSFTVSPTGVVGTQVLLKQATNTYGMVVDVKVSMDGLGGYFVAWQGTPYLAINIAHVNASRVMDWGPIVLRTTYHGFNDNYYAGLIGLCSDGYSGCVVCWGSSDGGTYGRMLRRFSVDGADVWSAPVEIASSLSSYVSLVLGVGDPGYPEEPEVPGIGDGVTTGYRVWSLFDGETDESAFDGSSGIPIPIMFETPEYDAGEPDTLKSFDRLQIYTKQGVAEFSARLTTENGTALATFSVEQVVTKWAEGSTTPSVSPVRTATSLVWNQGRWAGEKPGEATVGIPPGTLGKRCKLTVKANAYKKVVLLGHALDFQLLPERPYV